MGARDGPRRHCYAGGGGEDAVGAATQDSPPDRQARLPATGRTVEKHVSQFKSAVKLKVKSKVKTTLFKLSQNEQFNFFTLDVKTTLFKSSQNEQFNFFTLEGFKWPCVLHLICSH
jgi:hypothetical protein